MLRCIHAYPFVARNHGGIPFSGVCPNENVVLLRDCFHELCTIVLCWMVHSLLLVLGFAHSQFSIRAAGLRRAPLAPSV